MLPRGLYPGCDEGEGAVDAADSIVNLRRAVEGDDDVVETCGYVCCTLLQQQAGGQQGETDIFVAQPSAEQRQLWVQERFTAGKHQPADSQFFDGSDVWLQVVHAEGFAFASFPDVTHDAAAIAGGVRVDHQDGKGFDHVRVRGDFH